MRSVDMAEGKPGKRGDAPVRNPSEGSEEVKKPTESICEGLLKGFRSLGTLRVPTGFNGRRCPICLSRLRSLRLFTLETDLSDFEDLYIGSSTGDTGIRLVCIVCRPCAGGNSVKVSTPRDVCWGW